MVKLETCFVQCVYVGRKTYHLLVLAFFKLADNIVSRNIISQSIIYAGVFSKKFISENSPQKLSQQGIINSFICILIFAKNVSRILALRYAVKIEV